MGNREPRPRNLAGEAEHVQHRRAIIVDARGKHAAFPGRRGKLAAIEDCERFAKSIQAGQPIAKVDVLPFEEEAHEIRRRDRFNFGAEPVDRVAMDAREQRAIAPLQMEVGGRRPEAGAKPAAQDDPLVFKGEQGGIGLGNPDVQRACE